MNESPKSTSRKRIDERLIYLIPAAAALCFAFASLMMQFGNEIVDMENTCYYIYVNAPGESEDSFTDKISKLVEQSDLPGFMINRNVSNGFRKNGKLSVDRHSYMIILLNAQKKNVMRLNEEIIKNFKDNVVLVEEVLMKSYFMTASDVRNNTPHFRDLADLEDAEDVLVD